MRRGYGPYLKVPTCLVNLGRHVADRIGNLIALEEAGEPGLGCKPIGIGEYILETSKRDDDSQTDSEGLALLNDLFSVARAMR